MRIWPFGGAQADREADRLLEAVTAAGRQAHLFGEGRVADTLEGRFELTALFASLALIRLKGEPGAAPLAQAFTDKLFRQLDAGLREAGVGDLTVPKRMRRLAGAFYGRLAAYATALEGGDGSALAQAIERNLLEANARQFAAPLAGAVAKLASAQSAGPAAALCSADSWRLSTP